MDVIIVSINGIGNLLKEYCLPRLGRGDNQAPLPSTDRSDQSYQTGREIFRGGL